MPDTTSPQPDAATADPPKGGKGRLLVTGGLCVALAGAGFVLGGRLSGGGAEAAGTTDDGTEAEAEHEAETEPVIAEIVQLDPVNVNLADGHYLRIAVAIGISEHALHEEGGSGHGGGGDDGPPIETAPASDLVLGTFSGRRLEDLATAEGRESARHDLFEGLEHYYGEDIVTVFLTEFVMQ